MKKYKKWVRYRFNTECLRIILAGIIVIPLVILSDIFKPKTYYDDLKRGCQISAIRDLLALRPFNPNIFKIGGFLVDPYKFARIYPDMPNTIIMDNGEYEHINFKPYNRTIIYIKELARVISNVMPIYTLN